MSSNTHFGLTDEQTVYELSSTFHSRLLDILAYGIYTGVYFVALYLILSSKSERPRVGSVVVITVMWVLVTVHVSIAWAKLDDTYIRHGETRETQFMAHSLSRFKEFFLHYVVDVIVMFISLLLADMTMIWRCWVLYGRGWLVIVVPGLFLVTGSICYIWRTILIFTHDVLLRPDRVSNLEITFLLTTVLTNIFCTAAVVYRPVRVNGWMKSAKTYRRIVEILIESSILYTAIYMIRIGLQIHTQYFTEGIDDRAFFAQALGASITGIAPTLIITSVVMGQARTRPEKTPSHTSNLPPMKSTIRYFEETQAPPDEPATTRTVEDVERSCFEEDSNDHIEPGDNSRVTNLASQLADRVWGTGRSRVPLDGVPV